MFSDGRLLRSESRAFLPHKGSTKYVFVTFCAIISKSFVHVCFVSHIFRNFVAKSESNLI